MAVFLGSRGRGVCCCGHDNRSTNINAAATRSTPRLVPKLTAHPLALAVALLAMPHAVGMILVQPITLRYRCYSQLLTTTVHRPQSSRNDGLLRCLDYHDNLRALAGNRPTRAAARGHSTMSLLSRARGRNKVPDERTVSGGSSAGELGPSTSPAAEVGSISGVYRTAGREEEGESEGAGWGRRWLNNKPEEEEDGKEKRGKRKGLFTYDWDNGKKVKWLASKQSRAIVVEGGRKLSEYLALPPTEYSLLDPKMITRLTEDTFEMDCGTLNIVGTKVNPILFVRVDVQPERNQASMVVERVELQGSEAVRNSAGTFNVTSSTVVSSAELEEDGDKARELRTKADIEIEILVPNENFIPVGVLRRTGSFVMQRVLDIGLPQFTKFLKRDYARWAEGNDERAAVAADGESLIESDR